MIKITIGLIIGTAVSMVSFGSIHIQTVSVNATESVFSNYNETQILESGLSLIFENGLGVVSNQFKPTSNANASTKSALNAAMDAARVNQLEPTTNLRAYPSTASYYPTDIDCNYACLITRYFYRGLLSITGYNSNRQEEIIHEWEPHTPQLMTAIDTTATELLTGTTDGIIMPVRTPNGLYNPSATTDMTPTLNIVSTVNATVSQNLGQDMSLFDKYTHVFDIHVLGHEDVPTQHVEYMANSLAQWLDNQGVGTPNTWMPVVDQLKAGDGSALLLVPAIQVNVENIISLSVPNVINGPNPFNPAIAQTTRFQYTLGDDSDVEMHIYSLSGTKVYETSIQRGNRGGNKGFNSAITWDGRNKHGNVVANGVYVAYVKFTSTQGTVFSKCKVVVYK